MSTKSHEFWPNSFAEELGLKVPISCGDKIELSPTEKALAEIVYWGRSKKKGIRYCQDRGFHPGPIGIKDKRGHWWPRGCESCNYSSVQVVEEKDGKVLFNPWIRWKHCNSLPHIEYLVKTNPTYLLERVFGLTDLKAVRKIISMVENNEHPLCLEYPYWMIQELILDTFTSKFIRPYV